MEVNIGDERVNQTVSLQIAGTFHSSTVDLAESMQVAFRIIVFGGWSLQESLLVST